MVTGWEMLPETAKALSVPITKLVEVVAAGCGRVYEPIGIKRMAVADGAALVLREEAKARGSEIAMRAANRLLDMEVQRQENIEAVTQIALEQLPQDVSEEEVSRDWAVKFFREAQDVSNEHMRLIWGKLLAGEVARPGSFSHRTLTVVSNLSPGEANKFEALCALTARLTPFGLATFLLDAMNPTAKAAGLSLKDFHELQAAGLITIEPRGIALNCTETKDLADATIFIERPAAILYIATHKVLPASMPMGMISFTNAGQELFALADWRSIPEHDEYIAGLLASHGWEVQRKRITARLPDGRFRVAEFPQV